MNAQLGMTFVAACLLLQGCGPVGPGGFASVPQEFGGWRQVTAPPPPRGIEPYDGNYVGRATRVVNGDLDCPDGQPISGFTVTNNIARLGGFVGTVWPGGWVEMFYGTIVLEGQFSGPYFTGQIAEAGAGGGRLGEDAGESVCIYAVSLQRTLR